MRYNYWTSSKLVTWIRNNFGLPKPLAATSEEWKQWRKEYRELDPFMYEVTENWPTKIQNFIYWPADKLDNLYYFLNALFKDKYYVLPSTLEKGKYHEIDTRMLYCNFQALVNFVEIESASQIIFSSDKKEQKELYKKYGVKWYHKNRWIALFFPIWRSKEAGLDHLQWESELKFDERHYGYGEGEMPQSEKESNENFGKLTGQAQAAIKIRTLYLWWTEERPNRPDPMDVSGWTKVYNRKLEKSKDDPDGFIDSLLNDDGDSFEEKAEAITSSKTMWDLEEEYEKEDQEKLISLIELRKSLWT